MVCFDERELRLSFLPKWKEKGLIRRENGNFPTLEVWKVRIILALETYVLSGALVKYIYWKELFRRERGVAI